jgi:hypothetical protein
MTSTASSSPSRTSAPSSTNTRDADRRAAPGERDVADFERALRQRSALQDKGRKLGREREAAPAEEPPRDAALPPPPTALPAPFALALAQAQAQAQAPVDAAPPTRGLVEPPPAALRHELSLPAAPGGAEAARAFEISLREPLGGALTLHAVAPAAGARWALSIGAHGLNPQELRRNLGRLEERLRAKAVPHDALELHPYPDPTDDLP